MPFITIEEKTIKIKRKRVKVSNYRLVVHKIKKMRKEKGIDQETFGKALGLTRQSVINIEQGRHKISLEKFEKICAVLKCKSTDLLPF